MTFLMVVTASDAGIVQDGQYVPKVHCAKPTSYPDGTCPTLFISRATLYMLWDTAHQSTHGRLGAVGPGFAS